MHMSLGAEKLEEVKFAAPLLDMDINQMVSSCTWKYPQKIFLQVVFPIGRKSAPRLKLVYSSELKAQVSIDDVKLPSWLDGMCMAEYLPNLEEYLGKQLGRPVEADPVPVLDNCLLQKRDLSFFIWSFHISGSMFVFGKSSDSSVYLGTLPNSNSVSKATAGSYASKFTVRNGLYTIGVLQSVDELICLVGF
ncbi:hypothetical protein RJT34_33272 [Clitoria ternatea]|uniref:BRISC and BRCA1-A complex member 2 n=1 Tax=Clitoria ternatea TaxID=43366 RepID=A0AAN9EXJ6_CLITE